MTEAYIFDAIRTPRGKGRPDGSLHEVTSARLSAGVLNDLKSRNNLEGHAVEDVIWGNVTQVGEQGGCLARTAVLASQLEQTRWPASGSCASIGASSNAVEVVRFAGAAPATNQCGLARASSVSGGRALGRSRRSMIACGVLPRSLCESGVAVSRATRNRKGESG